MAGRIASGLDLLRDLARRQGASSSATALSPASAATAATATPASGSAGAGSATSSTKAHPPRPLRPIPTTVLTVDDISDKQSDASSSPITAHGPTTPSLTGVKTISSRKLQLERNELAKDRLPSLSNTQKVAEISSYFHDGQDLVAPGREYIMDSVLVKVCRTGPKDRRFFLFSDILVYGSIISKKVLAKQSIIPLSRISLVSLPDEPGATNAFEILSSTKSFVVHASSPEEKAQWIDKIKLYASITSNLEASKPGDPAETVEFIPVWAPDDKSEFCSLCQMVKFTTFVRRHHCRNCRRVVCGSCSNQSEHVPGLGSKRKVRVCDDCVPKLHRSNFRKMIQPTADSSASRLEWLCDSDSDSESEDLESLQTDHRFSRFHRTQRIHGI